MIRKIRGNNVKDLDDSNIERMEFCSL